MLSLLLGSPVRYSGEEVAASARMTRDEVARLWRAMGFADVGGSARIFTDADLAAVLRVGALIERGPLDLDALVDIVRSFGQTMSRLAEWQLDTLSRHLVGPEGATPVDGSRDDWERAFRAELGDLLPEFELLLTYAWRRQLTATLGRAFEEFDEPAEVSDAATVGFADLVSFTRLSRQLDRESLAMLVQTFETAAADVVYAAGGRLVKTLGDEVMFLADTAPTAAEISLRLHDLSRGDQDLPMMRVGLATGPVLMRMGDVFGNTVNRASRLTASARPGSTLLDSATVEAIGAAQDGRFATRAQAPRPIRGFGLVRPYALSWSAKPPKEDAAGSRPARDAESSAAEEASGSSGVSAEESVTGKT